ncbi:hypothetical protein ACWC4D_23870 [Streptomyces sp. NPDC001288]|uniref:hypothetical protein n=1 Tax=Streptomyces sp. NPDC001297 TaxID=3364559 RepID=UPI0036C63167
MSACTAPPPPQWPNTVWSPTNDSVSVDFRQCTPGGLVKDVGLGTVDVEMVRKSAGTCVMRYGNDLEDPRGDGPRMYTCTVPVSLGVQRFPLTETGVDMSPVDRYCTR